MKLKNITSGDKELIDIISGKRLSVGPFESIELEKAYYNKNTFKVVEEIETEQKEEINNDKEVN